MRGSGQVNFCHVTIGFKQYFCSSVSRR